VFSASCILSLDAEAPEPMGVNPGAAIARGAAAGGALASLLVSYTSWERMQKRTLRHSP